MEPNDFDKPLFVRDPGLRYRKERLSASIKKYNGFIDKYEQRVANSIHKIESEVHQLTKLMDDLGNEKIAYVQKLQEEFDRFEQEIPAAIARDERRLRTVENRLRRENAELRRQLEALPSTTTEAKSNPHNVARAKTLAIFDSILFAIENWSMDGQAASDCILAFQATLFPLVYMPIMKGNSDYYLDVVPVSALEVVKRGREFIKHIRSIETKSLMDPEAWDATEPLLRSWLINDGLPLIYGAKDEDWNETPHFTQSMMLQWRDQPASRALDFPLIWDGMELVKAHSDEIRKDSGLPEFNKQQLSTRLES